MVRAFLVALALLGATSSAMAVARAVATSSAIASGADAIEGCRAATGRTATVDRVVYDAGFCLGVVEGTMWSLQITNLLCLPKGVTHGQGLKVLVKYMDDHPEELHERVGQLAAEAFVKAWPCSR